MIRSEVRERVAIITIDNPPVNALPVAGWFELADTIRAFGRNPEVRAVIIAADRVSASIAPFAAPYAEPAIEPRAATELMFTMRP